MLNWIEINAERLRANVAAFQTILKAETAVMAVVKANAYGHGLEQVAPIVAERADWLGVNSLDEAQQITRLGIAKPVAILGHTPQSAAEIIVQNDYRQVVYRLDVARALSAAAERHGCTANIHVKVETGTNRQGVELQELSRFLTAVRDLPHVTVEGVYTHFANIEDTLDPSFAQHQLARFRKALDTFEQVGISPVHVHAAATSGILLYEETAFTMVRLGVGTYGLWPSRETQLAARERGRLVPLAPALSWKTRIVQVKHVPAGDYIGYGLTYHARKPMRVGVLPVGYYDGYDRKLSNSGRVLAGGQFASVVGRIAMNMTMIDLSDIPVQVDDEVVLIGQQGQLEIRAEELADKCGTITYEIVSRINPLIPRLITSSPL